MAPRRVLLIVVTLIAALGAWPAGASAASPYEVEVTTQSAQLRYFDCRERFGVRLELISDTPSVQAFFTLSERLARSWDGTSAPVRRFEEVTG